MPNIHKIPGGFLIKRPACATCGEPPLGDEYCCGHGAMQPVRWLTCNCCGAHTRGRQWFNRDTGYGMCVACIAFVRKQGMSEAEIHDLYGAEGIHWGENL
jgi:hypothetical protein